jgi:hypothetical protein
MNPIGARTWKRDATQLTQNWSSQMRTAVAEEVGGHQSVTRTQPNFSVRHHEKWKDRRTPERVPDISDQAPESSNWDSCLGSLIECVLGRLHQPETWQTLLRVVRGRATTDCGWFELFVSSCACACVKQNIPVIETQRRQTRHRRSVKHWQIEKARLKGGQCHIKTHISPAPVLSVKKKPNMAMTRTVQWFNNHYHMQLASDSTGKDDAQIHSPYENTKNLAYSIQLRQEVTLELPKRL